MPDCYGYATMSTTWVKQLKYTHKQKSKENFGSFSISAAVRPSNCSTCNKNYENPWDRQQIHGVN